MVVEREALFCSDAREWARWLTENSGTSDGVRLALAKKGGTIPGVGYSEALDIALCFGWIDGGKAKLDENHFLQNFGPRRARSIWSRINRDRALALIEAGRMQPAGLREIERARADGRWEAAYEGSKTIEVPDDLRTALDANPAVAEFFARLNSVNRYAILFRIGNVKRPETRARKIGEYVDMLARGETIYPQKT
ncbi:YdeI/OmpD-associated family protein [Subtercola sp. PAMC28395]|uniref:YdeI/OmpD-associated family protein n=1 Tax=Subtercola sp. PAMC28395 TaxID=2846775 RepID=UPI001C0DAB4B|nr:YdeI/OmpD-associated family protein [Subtercola sp. PAMC28395]QWT23440.1 YdeI/OmpD-associated family protein [Subtercola sp. PAMC28395]